MHQPGRRRRPPPRGSRRRRPRPRPRPRPAPRRRRPPPERQKKRESGTFEIRRGRSGRSHEEQGDDEPLDQIVLPQSMTQEAEEEKFVKRFGAERTADLRGVSGKVVLHQSAGADGPDRYIRRRRILIALAVFALAAVGGAVAFWPQIQGLLKR